MESATPRLKKVLYAALVLLILGSALAAYLQLRPRSADARAAGKPGSVVLKCTACGGLTETSSNELRERGYLDLEGVNLMGDGKICPKCGKPAMEFTERCPRDGTVFVPDITHGTKTKAARCPKCGWSPFPE